MLGQSRKRQEHFANPKNVGPLATANAVGLVGAMRWGDVVKLMLRIDPKTDRIAEARFQTFGCSSAIAASSALTVMVIGKTIAQAQTITASDIVDYLGGLPSEHMYCAIMGYEALRIAIDKYRGPAEAGDRVDVTLLCKCAGAAEDFVERTIRSNTLTDPEQVTFHTKAGRGCVACFRQIEAVLARVNDEMVDEGMISKARAYRIGSVEPRMVDVRPRGGEVPAQSVPGIGAAALRLPPKAMAMSKPVSVRPTASAVLREKLGNSEQLRLIESAIDDMRPHLQRDGGDCELIDVDGNTVFVKLTGACVGCQLASVTLSGVQAKLADKLGKPLRVVPVQ